ncbi:MAG: hypothetical protein IJ218_00210 [Alphaproteobacteria bacterium]|nr:hypothetical protein [Alphaproteobacteria bacterium]
MKKISARAYFFKKMFDCFMVGLFIIFLLLMWTLYKGPISVPYLRPYIVQALNYDENDYKVGIGDVNIELVRSIQPLRITANDITLHKKDKTVTIEAPKLYLSFSLRALLKGIIAPSDVSLLQPKAHIYASYGIDKTEIPENAVNKKKLQFLIEQINEFLQHYNSEDKIYPESYVDNITLTEGEIELHEVDLERDWIFSDVNFEFKRNTVNMELNANSLVNINDKIASVGFESKYLTAEDKLDLEVYFSDLILSDMMETFNETTEDNIFSHMSVEVPMNGKIDTTIKLTDILTHPAEAQDYMDGAIEKLAFEIDGGHGYISFEGEERYNYGIDEMLLSGKVEGGFDEIQIKNAEFKMGGQKAVIDLEISGLQTFYLEGTLQDLAMRFKVKVADFPFTELSRFWPRYVAEPAWQWCKDGLIGGHAQNAEFKFDFGYRHKTKDWGLLELDGTARLYDADLFYLDGMPIVHHIYGTAHFSDHNILIDIDKGVSDGVIITGGKVDIYDLDKEDNFISIDLIGNSAVKDALLLIDNKPLEFTSAMGLNPDNISGDVEVKLKLDFELRQNLDTDDIKVKVDADLHQIEIKDLFEKHAVSAENMKLNVNSSGWSLQGEGNFENIPVKLLMNEKFADKKYKSKCNFSFKLDDAAKKILGLEQNILNAPNMEGYALVNADVVIKEDGITEIDLSADLHNTKLDYAYFGVVKASGQPAEIKAKIKMKDGKVANISELSLIKPGFVINGNVSMYPSGRVKLVDVTKITGPRTSAKAKINLTDNEMPTFKIEVSGDSYDLSPLFDKVDAKENTDFENLPQQNIHQENEDDGLETLNNADIFVMVNSLWTNKTTPIKNFAGNAKLRHGIGIDEVNMVGNYGVDKSIKLNLSYVPRGDREHYLSVESNNAGSTLKVLRLYENMVGGTLKIEARRQADKKFIGHAIVRDFSIQDAPVVAQILSVASFTGMLDLLKGDGLIFTHFSAPFEYQYKILKLNHAKAEGSVVGLTTTGTYNRATDDVRFYGVVAPAYSLNRFLGKIPVVGNLLASKDGTIFAADYKAEGPVKDLDVDVNSLSILSPNSMKEWYNKNFGEGDGEL